MINQNFGHLQEAIVLDVETTGFSPQYDRIVSVAALQVDVSTPDGEVVPFASRVNPQRLIPWGAVQVHGITNRDVSTAPTFFDLAPRLHAFIGNHPIIGHNVDFDLRFLQAEFARAGITAPSWNSSFCTMAYFQQHFNGRQRKGSRLDDVIKYFDIDGRTTDHHDALEDVLLTWEVAKYFIVHEKGKQRAANEPIKIYNQGQDGQGERMGRMRSNEPIEIVNCNLTFEINKKYGIYNHPVTYEYTKHKFIGMKKNNTVQAILEVDSIFEVAYKGGKLEKVLVAGRDTDQYDNEIIESITEIQRRLGWDTSQWRFFCGECIEELFI